MNTPTVPVHEWIYADGHVAGVGTAAELQHWVAEGVFADGELSLGNVVCHEPASEDARRRVVWAKAA